MRIAVLTHTFFPIVGGAEVGIHEICSRLAREHDVTVVTPIAEDYSDPFSIAAPRGELPYRVLRYDRRIDRLCHTRRGKLLSLLAFQEARILRTLKRQGGLDVVNVHFLVPFGWVTLWCRFVLRVPVVMSLIGRSDVWSRLSRGMRFHARVTIAAARRVVQVTGYCLDGSRLARAAVIVPYGTDPEVYRPGLRDEGLRAGLGVTPDQTLMIAVQRLSPVKRVDALMDVAAELERTEPGKYVLAVVGTGSDGQSLAAKAKRESIANVRLLGYQDEAIVPALYASSDVYVSHSMDETFGMMFVQAMACGLPIVAARSTSIPYVVGDGVNGLVVEPFDTTAFADAVRRLARDDSLRERVATTNIATARREYSWSTIAATMGKIMGDVAGCVRQGTGR